MKKRIINFEVLRVVAMIFIVALHTFIEGGIMNSKLDIPTPIGIFNYTISELLNSVFYIAVNCYILITGYFLINVYEPKFKKVLEIWGHTFFYILGLTIIYSLLGYDVSTKDWLSSIFIVWGNTNWFINYYLALLLLAPFISILARQLSKDRYKLLLIILTILNVNLIKPANIPFGDLFDSYGGATLSWFTYLYLISGYIRLHKPFEEQKTLINKICFFSWFCIILQMIYKIYTEYQMFGYITYINIGSYNGMVYPLSLTFFILFKNHNFKNKIWAYTAKISPYMFGVLLFHTHFLFKNIIWNRIDICNYKNSMIFIPYIIIVIVIIFIVGITIDYTRAILVRQLKNKINISTLLKNKMN